MQNQKKHQRKKLEHHTVTSIKHETLFITKNWKVGTGMKGAGETMFADLLILNHSKIVGRRHTG